MNEPTPSPPAEVGVNRRTFLQRAAFTGAAAAVGHNIFAQDDAVDAEAGGAVTSLVSSASAPDSSLPPLAPSEKQPPSLNVPEPERKLGWAIVGLGELALEEILPAFGACKKSKLVALVSGHPEKARKIAAVHDVDANAIFDYGGFERIRENKKIDVVYIVLPNSLHAEFTIRALEAGKHVLCEKPMAVTVAECEAMIAAADKANRKLGVAYRLHYEPMNLAVMEMCRQKKFGTIKTFTGSNCQDVKAPNIRLSGPLGGGPVGDVGIYCINAARYTIGEEPIEAIAIATQPKSDPRFREVPESVSFLLRYASGVIAECQCSFGTARSSSYQVLCDKGSINMNPAYAYRGLKLWTESTEDGTPIRTDRMVEPVDQFAAEMDAFSDCVLQNKPVPTPGDLGLRDIRIVLAVMESAGRGGQPVKIG